jgi:hypothetical protein
MAADARRYGSPPGYTTHEHDETSHPDRHDRLGVADEQQRQRNSEAHLARVHARRCWAVRVLSVRLLAALMRRTVLPLELRCARSRANGVGPARNRGARTTVIWISAAAAWEAPMLLNRSFPRSTARGYREADSVRRVAPSAGASPGAYFSTIQYESCCSTTHS